MPSPSDTDRPADAVAVAQQYLSRERSLSGLLVAVVVTVFLGTYVLTSLLPAILIAIILLVILRAPLLKPHGTARLRSDATPETVRASFEGPTPPVLAFQWGVADTVTVENGTVVYPISYLFGLRTVDVTVRTETERTSDGDTRVELEVRMSGQPWATYTATITEGGDGTIVDITYESDRRFGLRYLLQQIILNRYRNEALEAQGYTVVDRDSRVQ